MQILKGYTKNLHCPEASIMERYIVEEVIKFCSKYIEKANLLGFPSLSMTKELEVRVQEDCMLLLQV